jgi:hypothetical protein
MPEKFIKTKEGKMIINPEWAEKMFGGVQRIPGKTQADIDQMFGGIP